MWISVSQKPFSMPELLVPLNFIRSCMSPDFPANVYLVSHSANKVTFSFLRKIFNKHKNKQTSKQNA